MFRSKANAAASVAALAIFLPALSTASFAQQATNPGWFTPKSEAAGPSPAAAPRHGHRAGPVAEPVSAPGPAPDAGDGQQQAQGPTQPPVLPQPPVPTINPLPKGAPPPAAVVGVISVPDIMRQSTAALQVQKEIVTRRDKLRDDVQREQMALRDVQQSLQDQHSLSSDQVRARVRALQDRENADKRKFQDRQRVVQEALQVALNQIERELVQVIRQVAESHSMNLVLHQEQIALNVQGFDITPQVLAQLNAVLPSVFIPADGVDPEQLARQGTFPTTAQAQQVSAAGPAPAPASSKGK